ncbi:hypothetical protein TIFTF001_026151 [Ficus carica]|uniref:Uncharacterized protein n=1 Tax=Ficus carica TaxID=3494 RepID=A0AA88DKQ3_FICCA|nr:hypothetical protein TIFTF001_026151 [Ficus carica]
MVPAKDAYQDHIILEVQGPPGKIKRFLQRMPTRVWLEVYFKKNPKPTTGGTRACLPNLVCSGKPHHPRGLRTIKKNKKVPTKDADQSQSAAPRQHRQLPEPPDDFTLFTPSPTTKPSPSPCVFPEISGMNHQFNPVKLGFAKVKLSFMSLTLLVFS